MFWSLFFIVNIYGIHAFKDDLCCCGCSDPCPVELKAECGAAPTTSCKDHHKFNQSELISPCSIIIQLHELTSTLPIPKVEFDPIPIGKDSQKTTTSSENVGIVSRSHDMNCNTSCSLQEILTKIPYGFEVMKITFSKSTNHTRGKEFITHMSENFEIMKNKTSIISHQMFEGLDNMLRKVMDGFLSILDQM